MHNKAVLHPPPSRAAPPFFFLEALATESTALVAYERIIVNSILNGVRAVTAWG